jgi:phosphoribosylglycinamide formyltransferase 1
MLKRVAVLCSHRAPGLLHLLNLCPDRGVAFEVVCVVSSESMFAEENRVERRGIPTLPHPIREFGGSREIYDAETAKMLEPFMPDLVLLDGYLYRVTDPMLRAFPSRILNLHFSDLALRKPNGAPRYPGLHAVRDAIAAGCSETRATVHVVNAELDAGPPIVRSWPFPVSPLVEMLRTRDAGDVFKAYVFAHQQWMMHTVSGPLIAAALRLIATHAVDLDALASATPSDGEPWLLEQHGSLLAPELDMA